jgi:hypothetical protein
MAGLLGRLSKIENVIGTDDGPRRIIIMAGTHYREPWIERHGDLIHFYVPVPDHGARAMDYLTDEMRRVLRSSDTVAIFGTGDNGRDPHLQADVPPWKRRPWRWVDDGRAYELQDEWGVWRRHEFE